jgi:hypothetical protein
MTTIEYEKLTVPAGWEIELRVMRVNGNPEAIITTPAPVYYFATVDFSNRGFRAWISLTGPFMTTPDGKRGKKLSGRGWRQTLVNNAVAFLQRLLDERKAQRP